VASRFQPGEMITNKQYQRLMSEYEKDRQDSRQCDEGRCSSSDGAQIPGGGSASAELQAQHLWRTRPDPVAGIWERAEPMLRQAPELEAKELFEYLCGMYGAEAGVAPTALRTFQRRVLAWRLQHGQDKEVFFAQEHLPGKVMQLDWTNANELGVTICGPALGAFAVSFGADVFELGVGSRCQSESLLSLRHGLQESLQQLGAVPERLQMDNSSAATHRVVRAGGS